MLIVAVVPSILFPSKKPAVRRSGGQTDTALVTRESVTAPTGVPVPTARPPVRPTAAPAETVWVTSPLYRLGFSTRGARLVRAELLAYRSFAPADSGRAVQLVPPGQSWLVYARTGESDTIALSDWRFSPSAAALHVGTDSATLTFSAERGGARVSI